MSSRATAENIASEIQKVCELLQIQATKIVVMLRDAASAMSCTARILKIDSIDCFIHKLQLCVKDAIKDYATEIEAARKICSKFNSASNFRRDFEQLAQQALIKVINCLFICYF